MYRIVGLGNNREEYQDTPHNIGKQILEMWIKNHQETFFSSRIDKRRNAKVYSGSLWGEKMEVVFHEEFMNHSGDVFNGVFNNINEDDKEKIIIVHDDVDLPFGVMKISFNRGDGGHNGIKDIIKKIKSKKIIRVKIGVCPLDFFGKCRKPKAGVSLNKYLVHKQLPRKYTEEYSEYVDQWEEILAEIMHHGYLSAMNKFN